MTYDSLCLCFFNFISFTQMPVVLSDDMYLNPIHQGWLTKEGKNIFLCNNNMCKSSLC